VAAPGCGYESGSRRRVRRPAEHKLCTHSFKLFE
jgi:hypothetical protein